MLILQVFCVKGWHTVQCGVYRSDYRNLQDTLSLQGLFFKSCSKSFILHNNWTHSAAACWQVHPIDCCFGNSRTQKSIWFHTSPFLYKFLLRYGQWKYCNLACFGMVATGYCYVVFLSNSQQIIIANKK